MVPRANPRARSVIRAVVLFLPFAVAIAPPPVQGETAPFPRRGEYVGVATCKDCHEEQLAAISAGAHGAVIGAPHLQGCETCHGPGKLHAHHPDNDPTLITHPPDLGRGVVAFCGRCHAEAARAHGGDLAGFLAAGKTCTSCHKVHEKSGPAPHPSVAFETRRGQDASEATAVGAEKCVTCHPLRDESLATSAHAHLAAGATSEGCETCHGKGSLHVETGGLARLITRPDRAGDGAATCRSCHEEVDAATFHWGERKAPFLSPHLTCASCHTVHRAKDAAAAPAASSPATNALCATCHAPAFTSQHLTTHVSLGALDRPLAQGCGACHTGGEAHARAGGKPDLVDPVRGTSAAAQRALCNQCHGGDEKLVHVGAGAHFRNDVGCVSCHSPAPPRGKVRADAERRCASCHVEVAAQFRQPHHHPVPEGAMGCSDCHDPHGARPKLRDLELREARCVKCHTEYQGPFVFAHQASRSDGCIACHTPHGASNKRLLKQHTTQQSCLQCHADFPIFHDQTAGAIFTNCLSCHTEVHGSNHSRYLFR